MNCGSCRFFHVNPQDIRQGNCHGLPPHPLLLPAPQPNGTMGMNINMMRPVVLRTEPLCSLHKPAIEVGARLDSIVDEKFGMERPHAVLQ